MTLDMQSVISRNESGHLSNPVGDEIILLNMQTGDYLGLNSVGAAIWDSLGSPQQVQALVVGLMAAFDVDEATCKSETMAYLERIRSLDLLRIHE
jgi:hypothetical protein